MNETLKTYLDNSKYVNLIEYKNCEHIHLKCTIDNNEWVSTTSGLLKSIGKGLTGCVKCKNQYDIDKGRKKALIHIKDISNIKMVEYINSQKIKVECDKGHRWFLASRSLKTMATRGKCRCKECRLNKSENELKQYINSYTDSIEIVKFESSRCVTLKCKKDNTTWNSTSGDIRKVLSNGNSGCSQCAKHGFNQNDTAYLYYAILTNSNTGEIAYKIGITNNKPKDRNFLSSEFITSEIKEYKKFENGYIAKEIEQRILSENSHLTIPSKYKKWIRNGNTEVFCEDVMSKYNIF